MVEISSLEQYIEYTENIARKMDLYEGTTTHPWFRGQSNSKWKLLPKLFRKEWDPTLERELYRDFKLRSTAYVNRIPSVNIEWLFIMQHYGMPTRLLDWTESSLHALFFAVAGKDADCDSCVWVLDPWSLNKCTMGVQTIPSSAVAIFDDYVLHIETEPFVRKVKGKLPVALRPLQNNPRLIAQKGTFTVFGSNDLPLDIYVKSAAARKDPIKLERIIINKLHKKSILHQLILSAISEAVLFPDLDRLSRDISFRYSEFYMKK